MLPWSPLPRALCALHPLSDSPVEARGPQPRAAGPCHGVVALRPPCQRSPPLEPAGRWLWLFSVPTMGKLRHRQKDRPGAGGGSSGRGSSSVPAPWQPWHGDAGARLRVAPPGTLPLSLRQQPGA